MIAKFYWSLWKLDLQGKLIHIVLLVSSYKYIRLNLTTANHVILIDLWWNPAVEGKWERLLRIGLFNAWEDQAIDRVHRVGQTRPVSVKRLIVNDSFETKILTMQEKKVRRLCNDKWNSLL